MYRFTCAVLLAGAVAASCEGKRKWTAGHDDAPPTHARMDRHAHRRTADSEIRPFEIHATDAELADLLRRLEQTRWPTRESLDPRLTALQELVFYWRTNYDWRAFEARLNELPQFVTTIEGVDIHFIHVRSRHPNAMPIIITHGSPGSVIDLLKVIGPLTDPPAYGGRAEDSFDVVLPSIPGVGFSGKPTSSEWDPERIARVWAELMKRLGYGHYVAQGGDFGGAITAAMARQHAPGLAGIHLNNAGLPTVNARPELNGVALADSPAALADWLLMHPGLAHWTADAKRSPTRDDVLDEITLLWLTKSQPWVTDHALSTLDITLPVSMTDTDELAAWEQPLRFAEQTRMAFRPLR